MICKFARLEGEATLPTPKLTTDHIRHLIRQNRADIFYKHRAWQETASEAREQQHNECQRCKVRGFYSPCEIVHHKKHLKKRPDLAYELENLECLCLNCHNEEHSRDKSPLGYINEERW